MKPTPEMIEAERETAMAIFRCPTLREMPDLIATAIATARMEGHNAGVEKAAAALKNNWEPGERHPLGEVLTVMIGCKIGGDA